MRPRNDMEKNRGGRLGSFEDRPNRPFGSPATVVLLLGLVASSCLKESQIPVPVLGAEAAELSCSARYPLLDDDGDTTGTVSIGSQGITKSTSDWGAGPRFHLAFTFHNKSDQPVQFIPASVRLSDSLGVDLRMVEVKRGDVGVAETTIVAGDTATVDLFFAALGLKATPQRMQSFTVRWAYAVGDAWWSRTTLCRQATEPPPASEGFGPWVAVRDPKIAATEKAQRMKKGPEPVSWPLNYSR